MLQAYDIFEDLCDELDTKQFARTGEERRDEPRAPLSYRPCCVSADGKVFLGLIRNQSEAGAKIQLIDGFDAASELKVGDRLAYFWDSDKRVEARIIWREGCEIGVANEMKVDPFRRTHPYRSVRIPFVTRARFWHEGVRYTGEVRNVSIGGLAARHLPDFAMGTLLTVKLGTLEICNASVRWREGGITGINFQDRLSKTDLAKILREQTKALDGIEFK